MVLIKYVDKKCLATAAGGMSHKSGGVSEKYIRLIRINEPVFFLKFAFVLKYIFVFFSPTSLYYTGVVAVDIFFFHSTLEFVVSNL